LRKTQVETEFFKIWGLRREAVGEESPNTAKKQNTPFSNTEGGYFLKTKRVKLFSGFFFGRGTRGFGMLFTTNAVRTFTAAVTTSARNPKSQQHKNDHQFFH
jgi:hypothetical protein